MKRKLFKAVAATASALVLAASTGCSSFQTLLAGSGKDPNAPDIETIQPGSPTPRVVGFQGKGWWKPKVGDSFQVQYTGDIDLNVPAAVYSLDWEGTSQETVAALQAKGIAAVCYINAGAVENWRTDKSRFPAAVVGKPMTGWRAENWLDIRRLDVIMPVMADRMETCRRKGFYGVDPDNMDAYAQASGFTITAADQIAYMKALATKAHSMKMGIGLKNDRAQIPDLTSTVDFAVSEECLAFDECKAYVPFLAAGKAVFDIEYSYDIKSLCAAAPAGMTVVRKEDDLGAKRQACNTGG